MTEKRPSWGDILWTPIHDFCGRSMGDTWPATVRDFYRVGRGDGGLVETEVVEKGLRVVVRQTESLIRSRLSWVPAWLAALR